MYADRITDSMKGAIEETSRRRSIQSAYNREHNITPTTVKTAVRDVIQATKAVEEQHIEDKPLKELSARERVRMANRLRKEMKDASRNWEFERAAALRDLLIELEAEKPAVATGGAKKRG
jgi:excinuclease ABC subunit B